MALSASTAPATGQSREISPVSRRDIFDFLRAGTGPWWGRLSETGFLDELYDLDALPSTDPRHATAAEDITRHRMANFDWDDDWIFDDPRFQLADGPDQVLLAFLAQMAHPLVQPDSEQATRLVADLNSLLAPDGWELRTSGFVSGRPVYAPGRTASGPGRMIRLQIEDDAGKLDLVLGQAHCLLGENGDVLAQSLILGAALAVRRDGGIYHPIPGDNWNSYTYEAVLTVDPGLAQEFTTEVTDRIWAALGTVFNYHGREDIQSLVIEQAALPLPAIAADWRDQAAQPHRQPPTNQARRERAEGGYPSHDGLVFGSRAELAVYQVLVEIQRDCPIQKAIAVLPLPGAKLRDFGVRTPDFVVLGNGRAAIIEVDGPHHYGRTRKADDATRDRHWGRCGVPTIRITSEHADDPGSLKAVLQEDLKRELWRSLASCRPCRSPAVVRARCRCSPRGHSLRTFPAENCPLLSASQVHFALLLKIDPHAEVRHQLLEGLEGVLDVSERGKQLQPPADLLQTCHLLPPRRQVSFLVRDTVGQQFLDRARKALFLPLGEVNDRLPPRS